jgi:ATP-dependent protease ClpP protease subunit
MIFNRINKKIKKLQKYLTSAQDKIKYAKFINREIILNAITPDTAEEVDSLIRYWNDEAIKNVTDSASKKTIKIYINATDGDIASALMLVDTIKLSKVSVDTINIGYCLGSAMLVYLAGHKRYAYPNAIFSYKYTNLSAEMGAEEQEPPRFSLASIDEARLNTIKSLFIEKTKLNESKFLKQINNGFWFTAQTALDQFICNEILKIHYLSS